MGNVHSDVGVKRGNFLAGLSATGDVSFYREIRWQNYLTKKVS